MMDDRIHVVLEDPDALLRSGLRALMELEPDLRVVGEADTGETAVRQACVLRPRVVLIDLDGMDGLEATRRITAAPRPPAVLFLTCDDERTCLFHLFAAGAHGHVQKTQADEQVTEAVRAAARGEVFLSPSAIRCVLRRHPAARAGRGFAPPPELTEDEARVLRLASQGYPAARIASTVGMKADRVRACRTAALRKLGLGRRQDLAVLAAGS
jgi:two-component system response regulator NreC